MRNGFFAEHWVDISGEPSGGVASGRGFTISWQKGALGTGSDRKEPNGAFVEDVIEAAANRLQFYETTRFACAENEDALQYLHRALECLRARTKKRQSLGIEGTHEIE